MKVSATFTSQLMSSHSAKITQVSIEINGNLYSSQICHSENSESFHSVVDITNY